MVDGRGGRVGGRRHPYGLSAASWLWQKGGVSSLGILDDWYPVCSTEDLRTAPRPVVLLDHHLVLFRDERGVPCALLDRCAHRNVPLSKGRVREGCVECFYHGWRFDRTGVCRRVPGLEAPPVEAGRVAAFACRELDGLIWVWGNPDQEPMRDPYRFHYLNTPKYASVHQVVEADASVHQVAENALDVPHTAFLHGGLFRKPGRNRRIEVVVRRSHDRVEAEYIGEPVPEGLMATLLSGSGGGVVQHTDRFILPSVVEVDYRLGDRTHLVSVAVLSPVSATRTRLFTVTSLRLPIPAALVAPLLKPLGQRVFRQDAAALRLQSENIRRFGGERFVSTELDVLGGHVRRLLNNAGRGDREPVGAPVERRFSIHV